MSHQPLVSVIMSVYNGERYVAQTIESILKQTFADFEFIIVNNGSTDGTLKILEKYAALDERIHLISHGNHGMPRAINEILPQTRGEFIANMEADDIALPERLALQVKFLQQHHNVLAVSGCFELIDEKGRLLTRMSVPQDDAEIQKLLLAGHCSLWHPCALMRRTPLIEVGYDNAFTIAYEMPLWLKLGEMGELANLQETLLQYRLHSSSSSEQNMKVQRQQARMACEQAWQRRGIEGKFEASAPWRPGKDRASRYHFMLQYGWWAFNNQQRQTAAIYAIKAIAALPFKLEGWKLLFCAALKPKLKPMPQI